MSKTGWQLLQPAIDRGARFTRACVRIDDTFGEVDISEVAAWLERMEFFDDHRADDWPADWVPPGRTFDFVVLDNSGNMWSPGAENGVASLLETPATPSAWLQSMRSSPDGLIEIHVACDTKKP